MFVIFGKKEPHLIGDVASEALLEAKNSKPSGENGRRRIPLLDVPGPGSDRIKGDRISGL